MLVDTHVHVVADDDARYPLQPSDVTGPWYRTHPCSAERLLELMVDAGVDRTVVVQGVSAYGFDNRYLLESVSQHAGTLTSVVCTGRRSGDAVAEVERLVRERGARGYRWVTFLDDGRLDEPRALWDALGRLGIPVVVTFLADRLPEFAALVPRLPAISLAVDHCGFADLSAGVPDELAALGGFPNVSLKVSTQALRSAAAGGDPADAVAELAARFGGRVMWGSDYSQTHDVPYAELVEEGRRAAAKLGDDDRARYYADTALALWPELT